VGTLLTLDLPAGSPIADLPWVITIGTANEEEEWDPFVCGPYERAHALALARAVVADEDLLAVVEPLLPLVDADAIRDEVELFRAGRQSPDVRSESAGSPPEADEPPGVRPGPVPQAADVKAAFARIAARLPR
jgi:hypothetical protein